MRNARKLAFVFYVASFFYVSDANSGDAVGVSPVATVEPPAEMYSRVVSILAYSSRCVRMSSEAIRIFARATDSSSWLDFVFSDFPILAGEES